MITIIERRFKYNIVIINIKLLFYSNKRRFNLCHCKALLMHKLSLKWLLATGRITYIKYLQFVLLNTILSVISSFSYAVKYLPIIKELLYIKVYSTAK